MNLIDENKVNKIYEKFILSKLNDEYRNKYEQLSHSPENGWDWYNKDFCRVISLLEFKEFIQKSDRIFKNILVSNGENDPELKYLNFNHIDYLNYEIDKKDLHELKTDIKYDFFMLNQTLEHTYDPCLILRNIYQIMEDDGLIYINVPSLCPPHNTPHHYYNGFTPVGLGCIVEQAGFEICDIGFWGNKEYVMYLFEKNDWADYFNLKNFKNDFNYASISWIFGKKGI